ncbi:MAG TPA: CPBP family intramembrane metalloprotease domain-containing protein [Treponema sp.]|nr:CPBP family intramembrane metalloprotease domain-containing protein [Treponema sp.]
MDGQVSSGCAPERYVYKPKRFYLTVFALTWACWLLAIICRDSPLLFVFMLLGLLMPALTAVITVLRSKNDALIKDFKRKIVGFYRIRPLQIIMAVSLFALVVALSIGTSVLFGGSPEQFAFTQDFSFSIGGSSALLTILLASTIEELGWRGYGEDAVGAYNSWFKESVIFGCVWACWHIPLFWVPGSYQQGLTELGALYVLNFFVSAVPLNFIQTWVYVKNKRSMLATIIFHLFINTMQEKIAMTPETKCIETIFVVLAAVLVVLTNKQLFFETEHIGHMPDVQD